jgi:cobalamin biosynthesis protein CbiD
LSGLGAAAAALLAAAVLGGGVGRGQVELDDPCGARPAFSRGGVDATVQRIALDGLDGAACELGTSRERLLLSLDPSTSGLSAPWSQETAERAIRAGVLRAIDEAAERGTLGETEARIMREIVERAPLELLLRGAGALGDLLP